MKMQHMQRSCSLFRRTSGLWSMLGRSLHPRARSAQAVLRPQLYAKEPWLRGAATSTSASGPAAGPDAALLPVTSLICEPPFARYTQPHKLSSSVSEPSYASAPVSLSQWMGYPQAAQTFVSERLPGVESLKLVRKDVLYQMPPKSPGYLILDQWGLRAYFEQQVLHPLNAAGRPLLGLNAEYDVKTLLKWQSNRVVTLWNQQGMRSGFALDIRTCDAVPTAMCTAVQYEADMRGAEATHTVKVVRTMHGYLVANGLTYGAIFNGDAFVFTKIDRSAPSADGTSFPMYMSEPIHMDQRAPSALGGLLYLMQLAMTDPSGGSDSQQPGNTHPGRRVHLSTPDRASAGDAQVGEGASRGRASAAAPITDAEGPVAISSPSCGGQLLAACSNTAFRFGRLLGSGKTGYVMEGQYKGVKVAVKVAHGEDEAPALRNEVDMLLKLRPLWGRCVPALVAHGTLVTPGGDTYPFLATELVTNAVTLRSAVQAGISADALRKAWAHAREAVNEINGLGIVHHGLHNDTNIIVTQAGDIKFVDFADSQVSACEEARSSDVSNLDAVFTRALKNPDAPATHPRNGWVAVEL